MRNTGVPKSPQNRVQFFGFADLYAVPYSNRTGGPATPVPGASDPDLEEYYPTYSPDDALLATTELVDEDLTDLSDEGLLDRVARYDTPLDDAVKLALISMDSTLRSNFSVGLPADLLVYRRDTQRIAVQERIEDDNEYFRSIRENWSDALRKAYRELPAPPWMS